MANLTISKEELEKTYEEILTILGAFSIDVDIEKKEVLIVLRRAFQEFEKETSIWQLQNQFGNVYGMTAGQTLTNQLAVFNMNLVNQITDWFASMQRIGGKVPWHKDYIVLEPGRQIYDLSKESSKPYAPGSRRVHRVMWVAQPELLTGGKFTGGTDTIGGDDILYSNSWNFTNSGLNYGGSALNYLGYAFDTMLLLQSTEIRRKMLFSEFFYNIAGDMLELFPMGGGRSLNIADGTKVFYYYWDERELAAGKSLQGLNGENLYENEINNMSDAQTMFKKATVSGVQDGTNKVFTISPEPVINSEMVVFQGQTLTSGLDYTLNGATLTMSDDFPAILAQHVLTVFANTPVEASDTSQISASEEILIANPAMMQISSLDWKMLSPWAKTWVWEWTLARCKYIQGAKWRKIKKTFNSADSGWEVEFDYSSLLQEAKEEMDYLRQTLRDDLKELNLSKLMEDKKNIVDNAVNISKRGGRLPFIG